MTKVKIIASSIGWEAAYKRGAVVDVTDDCAADWVKRGLATADLSATMPEGQPAVRLFKNKLTNYVDDGQPSLTGRDLYGAFPRKGEGEAAALEAIAKRKEEIKSGGGVVAKARRMTGLALFLCAMTLPALGYLVTNLNGVTTTGAGDAVNTHGARYVSAQVWSAAGGTYTVKIQERQKTSDGSTGPWLTVATMSDCDANGLDGSSAVCEFHTITPAAETRLNVTARSSGTIYGVLSVAR